MNANYLLNAIASDDVDNANGAFQSMLQDMINDALEVRKVELASTIMTDLQTEARHTHQVVYTVPGEGKQKQYYHVTADDEDHAREQLMNAQPTAKIHKVEKLEAGKPTPGYGGGRRGVYEETVTEGEGMNAQRRWVRQVASIGKEYKDTDREHVVSIHRNELKKAARKYFQSRQPHGAEFVNHAASTVRDARKQVKAKRLQGEETIAEDGPTRKHFQQTADLLKNIPDEGKRKELAQHHAGLFKAQNPRFDRAKFMAAAGVNEDTVSEAPITGHIEKGAFHRWLGKGENEPITAADIKKGLAAGGHAAKMANFARNAKKWQHEGVVTEVLDNGSVGNSSRNILQNIRRGVAALKIKGVNPTLAARAHADYSKLVAKNPKAPGFMLLRRLAPNKAAAVQTLTQSGMPLGGALEANPADYNQALQRVKRFK